MSGRDPGEGSGGLWAMGSSAQSPEQATVLAHWDGSSWTSGQAPGADGVSTSQLSQVPGTSMVWAVGSQGTDTARWAPLADATGNCLGAGLSATGTPRRSQRG